MSDSILIDRFLEMMAAERGASRNTLAAYKRDLKQAAERVHGSLGEAGADDLRALMAGYAALAASSAARKLSALRQFFAFLLYEGERADNPALDIARPATRRPLPRILTHADVERLFAPFMSPGSVTERLWFFTARYSPADRISDGGGAPEEGEDIEVLEMTSDEALAGIADGLIVDAKTIILIQYLKRNPIKA